MKKWNKEYVREKYQVNMLGQRGIYYPSKSPRRLIVFFSSMGIDRYDRYSWFWSETEIWQDTAYLFLKDDSFHYFLGTDEKPLTQTFRKIIAHHMTLAEVGPKQVFCVGGSMGGYAAIYYASLLQLNGAIVSNPQLDYSSTRAHQFQNWERQIREIGSQWYDLSDFLFKSEKPNIYLEYGDYPADLLAAERFCSAYSRGQGLIIIRKAGWKGHTVNSLSKQTIESTINFFENHGFDKQMTSEEPGKLEDSSSFVEEKNDQD